ncbi:HAMP domain-containing sensor histidine kinase [Clostridium sp.]|uniref:sensor histidine kinase n=1 Tax=Clostridium sp. TaxID=1506 RepID=UPI0028481DDC|nr:HAMP domain-containing sensor histidine kinase [Clostridium sp.]MDR3598200.1 HAMP domain-containing sensor histidine kinase [Clostridium sp.]
MKLVRFKSLAIKIWITYAIIILIIICSCSCLYIDVFSDIEEKAKIEDLSLAHDILLEDNNFNNSEIRLNEMKNLKGSKHIILNIPNNNEIYVSDIKQKNDNYHEADEDGMRTWMASFIKEDKLYEKQFKASYKKSQVIFIISSIESNNAGKSYLISYMKDSKYNNLIYMVMGIGIIFIILGFFIAKIVANAISSPIKKLEEFTVRIARKKWNEPIKINSEDEIGRLAEAMNEMQEALKHNEEEERVFLQSISHDLKTPVMVIMSHAEAIIDGVYIESVENTAEIIKKETVNLQKKINQLLYLNTLDYALQNNNKSTEINLQNLLFNTINRFKLVNSKIMWEVETRETVTYGNIEKIQIVIENILDNQLRYAKEKIDVSLKEENEYAILEIHNDGPKIDEKHIKHIFNNLYKDKTGNFGLGLAICKKIIDFYKGEILAINKENGVSFIIKIPCSK